MKIQKLLFLLLSVLMWIGCSKKTNTPVWIINEQEYLETPGFNVLVFHDYYPEGKQGGIEFIQQEERIAANGFIDVQLPDRARFPQPAAARRIVNQERKEIRATVTTPGFDFNYSLRVWPEKNTIHLAVDFEKPIPEIWKGKVTFNLQLYPVAYSGKTYHLGEQFGVFPVEGLGPMITGADGTIEPSPLARGSRLIIAPEDPRCKLQIQQVKGELCLIDGRNSSLGGWIDIRSEIPTGIDTGAMEWIITPSLLPDWIRNPVIALSQVGYHPAQVKQAIIELDAHSGKFEQAILHKIGEDGIIHEIKSGSPRDWGKFLRYRYAIFDFSEIKDPGIYTVSYGNAKSEPFSISKDVYKNSVWQPTLEIFFPVQMCHMRIRDRSRVWHGACHLDDALQAPVSTMHVDGYQTYANTETRYKPFTQVPGLNRGGWHDAGDNDLAAGSQAQTTLYLALAGEEFGINVDQTSINQKDLLVEVRKPDGIPDLQQQIEHGVINLLSGYRASGHSFVGIIETKEGRNFLGDVASLMDQRWVVTNKDASLEYEVVTALAAASRLLRNYNNALADECLKTATMAWNYEQNHEPVLQPNAYVPGHREWQEVNATCELLITTGDKQYSKRLIALLPVIKEAPEQVGWFAARTLNMTDDEAFKNAVKDALQVYSTNLDKSLAENPFGVPWKPAVWGIGWDIQDHAVAQYYLNRAFPEMFNRENVCRVVNFVLGCHPGSSTSFVSAVGTHSLIPAYGFNMHWWSYIPGGMASGTALIRPDFPELKEPYPYLWQQAEYVMPGAASYVFCVLAADHLLNMQE